MPVRSEGVTVGVTVGVTEGETEVIGERTDAGRSSSRHRACN
jgi:hypothetical protein